MTRQRHRTKPCSIEGCENYLVAQGLCAKHYQRMKKYGTTEPTLRALDGPSRLWARIDRSDDCWEWQGHRDKDGYGQIVVNKKPRRTHRYAWELTNGPIPESMCVCHRCDNPPCCNPAHLWLGTNDENMADCTAKGRRPTGDRSGARKYPESRKRGEEHHMARFTREEAAEIIRRYRAGEGPTQIGRDFGAGRTSIRRIAQGKTWHSRAA